jgi:DNA-binding HxlR family transcriptional regulator
LTVRAEIAGVKYNLWTMKAYGEYCPIAMGSEVISDRWTPLVLRELIIGSRRFTDIHRGVPRMSRTLLTQRLRQLERLELVERTEDGYSLTPAGKDIEPVIWAIGDWAAEWLQGDPDKQHHDAAHAMWRVKQRIVDDAIPAGRTVVQFNFRGAVRGSRLWLLLDRSAGPSVCERDEGFDVDLWVDAEIGEFLRVWAGRSTWDEATRAGALTLNGPRPLVRAFPSWFALSPFVERRRPSPV